MNFIPERTPHPIRFKSATSGSGVLCYTLGPQCLLNASLFSEALCNIVPYILSECFLQFPYLPILSSQPYTSTSMLSIKLFEYCKVQPWHVIKFFMLYILLHSSYIYTQYIQVKATVSILLVKMVIYRPSGWSVALLLYVDTCSQ